MVKEAVEQGGKEGKGVPTLAFGFDDSEDAMSHRLANLGMR